MFLFLHLLSFLSFFRQNLVFSFFCFVLCSQEHLKEPVLEVPSEDLVNVEGVGGVGGHVPGAPGAVGTWLDAGGSLQTVSWCREVSRGVERCREVSRGVERCREVSRRSLYPNEELFGELLLETMSCHHTLLSRRLC